MSTSNTIRKIAERARHILKVQGYKIKAGSVTKKNKRPKRDRPLPEQAKARMQWALDNTWAVLTLEKYKFGVEAFHRFCDEARILSTQRRPASEELLCCFTASRAGEIAGGTARSAVAAVKAWHIRGGAL
jgi:hypothetical protein